MGKINAFLKFDSETVVAGSFTGLNRGRTFTAYSRLEKVSTKQRALFELH